MLFLQKQQPGADRSAPELPRQQLRLVAGLHDARRRRPQAGPRRIQRAHPPAHRRRLERRHAHAVDRVARAQRRGPRPRAVPRHAPLDGAHANRQHRPATPSSAAACRRAKSSNRFRASTSSAASSPRPPTTRFSFDEQNRFNWNLNDVAYGLQQLEINGDADTLSVLRSDLPDEADGPSLSYQLAGGVSLASRSDQQMVRIMQTDMESHFYHVAVPVLTSYVYREAELTNSSDEDLLAGPITVYLDGRFVGQSEIPTVARGQTFVVGFGADPQLRARRELADKKDGVQGGNRETRFEYRLVVENFAGEATPVRVLDRLPHAENGDDIRVTLGETSDPISDDKLYQREERPMGLLRWDIEVAANAAGEEARLIDYHYAVEYDRQYVVSLPESKQSLQEEFERLQRDRQKRYVAAIDRP